MANKRTDEEYEIEALSKGIVVLEALATPTGEPVLMKRILERTELPYDTVMRTLKTLRLRGYAVEEKTGWTHGPRFMRFACDVIRNKL